MEIINLEYIDVFDKNIRKKLQFSKYLINSNFNEKSLFANIVDGKSMEPFIKDKSIVIADLSQKQLFEGSIYLLYYKNKMWIKKYNTKEQVFYSINKDFSHFKYKLADVHIVAKVLMNFQNL